MHMPIVMVIMTLMIVPFFTFSQEEPVNNEQTEESSEASSSAEATADTTADTPAEEQSNEATEQEQPAAEETQPESDQPVEEETPTATEASSSAEATTDTTADTPAETPVETPEIPAAPDIKEDEIVIPEDETMQEEPAGIDTVSLENPQGNWLFKKIWWERAEDRYEKIRLLVDAIWESRNKFFFERNQLDRNILNPFYMNIGIDRGELQAILSEINDFIAKEREQHGDLTEQERGLYETYTTEEETLKQLKIDVDTIVNLDGAINEALGTLMQQINRVREYESKAWNNFKEIAHILNDARARELYYMIEGAARNIKSISTYLEQEFFAHFHKLIEDAKKRVDQVQNQMNALKEKGVLFQRQADQLEQQTAQANENEKEDEEEENEEAKPKPPVGWFDWIISLFSDTFSYVFSIIRMPYDMIFGK